MRAALAQVLLGHVQLVLALVRVQLHLECVLVVRRLVLPGVLQKLIVLLLRLGLGGGGVRFQPRKVGGDHLEHTQDAALGRLLPGVGIHLGDLVD